MSDAFEAGFLRRLLLTPVSDLFRGQVTGRRVSAPVRAARAARAATEAALPPEARDLVLRVVKRTRLRPREKADVAAELIAHFADGLDAGTPAGDLLAAFGHERQAARLIRRAKIRNRSLPWHFLRFVRRLTAALVLLYAALAARFYVGRPTVAVDYFVQLNAQAERTPADQRAWPTYARALVALDVPDLGRGQAATRPADDPRQRPERFGLLLEARPGWRTWGELGAWVDAHAAGIELARQAAAKPTFGFVLGPNGSQLDPPLGIDERSAESFPLLGVRLPTLNHLRTLGLVLAADLAVARSRGEGDRVARDVDAILGVADHLRRPFVINQLVAMGVDEFALKELGRTLTDAPAVLSDAALVRLAHRLAELGARVPLVDVRGERLFFYDVIQRSFTDDGDGDGRLTPEGVLFLQGVTSSSDERWLNLGMRAIGPLGVVGPRRAQVAEYDRIMDVYEAQLLRPARDADLSAVHARVADLRGPTGVTALPAQYVRYLPVSILVPAMSGALEHAERLLGQRDGLTVAIALELHRRRHGAYPASLDALVPGLLPAVPADRISGDPLRFRLVDGKPVVYSVGVDRDDDGGRRPAKSAAYKRSDEAARWPHLDFGRAAGRPGAVASPAQGGAPAASTAAAPPEAADGDWVLFPAPPDAPEPEADQAPAGQ
jgi:hypothetical protein